MAVLNINSKTSDMYSQFRDYLTGAYSEGLKDIYGGGKKDAEEDIKRLLSTIGYSENPQEAFQAGVMNIQPGYIAANYRSPEQIQALRKMIAEEMRSRGPVNTRWQNTSPYSLSPLNPDVRHMPELTNPDIVPINSPLVRESDPIDQILRGSWYHGMSGEARNKVYGPLLPSELRDTALAEANYSGFPLSLHDSASISNKLGEPAGVSISMLPTKAKDFSADEYIHRVLPQYGGPPTQRVVNLMSPEGRTALNDAYDVVLNKYLSQDFGYGPSNLRALGEHIDYNMYNMTNKEAPIQSLMQDWAPKMSTTQFNPVLSNQLQSQGYRGILYNPQRWNEYEMLMLDPKYVLPLDYRKYNEYIPQRLGWKGPANQTWTPSELSASLKEGPQTATPGIQKGLSQIQDDIAKNASRLGDIYSERPWVDRLNIENKNSLLQLIDEQYREQVGNQLFRGY